MDKRATIADLGPLGEAALAYAAAGLYVTAAVPLGKEPATTNGSIDATRDPEIIRALWTANPNYNIICAPDRSGHFVLDQDGARGAETLAALELDHGLLPATLTFQTPRGEGHLHYWFKGRTFSSTGTDKHGLGPKLDTRGYPNGYVLLPPSRVVDTDKGIDGVYSLAQDRETAQGPAWIGEILTRNRDGAKSAPNVELDLPVNVERAASLLRGYVERGDVAVEGAGGDNRTYNLSCEMLSLGLSEDKALELMQRIWNPACEPPWDKDELATKVHNAAEYMQNDIGAWAVAPVDQTFSGLAGATTDADTPLAPSEAEQQATPLFAKLSAEPQANGQDDFPEPLSAEALAGGNFPPPEYLLPNRKLLIGNPNALYGDGGSGKTTLALNRAVKISAGLDGAKQADVLLVLSEDNYGAVKEKLEQICTHYGVTLSKLPMEIWCPIGQEVVLAAVSDIGVITPRPFLARLEHRLRPKMFAVLDALVDIGQYDESSRIPATAFLKRVIGGLCTVHDVTIQYIAHTSKASVVDGSLYAGTTAHNNAIRNREHLDVPVKGNSHRVLTTEKNNYGPETKEDLYLLGSVFLTADDAGQVEREAAVHDAVMETVLSMIDQGIRIVRASGSGQKFEDVAKAVREKRGVVVTKGQVKDILSAAERHGKLIYVSAATGSHTPAGFERGPQSPGGPPRDLPGQRLVVVAADVATALGRLSGLVTTHVLAVELAGPGAGERTVADIEKALRSGARKHLAAFVDDRGGKEPGDKLLWKQPAREAGQ
jgi:hypothetical protein